MELPEIMPPGFVTLRFANGDGIKLIVAEESLPALRRLFEIQLWHAAAPPLVMLSVEDSLNNRWFWQPQR